MTKLTDSETFLTLTPKQQVSILIALQEKRKSLQYKQRKSKPIKLPAYPFKSQEHKMCFLQLPQVYRKLFI